MTSDGDDTTPMPATLVGAAMAAPDVDRTSAAPANAPAMRERLERVMIELLGLQIAQDERSTRLVGR